MTPWYSLSWFSPTQWQQFRFAYSLALYLIPAVLLLFALRYYLYRNAQQRLNMSLNPVFTTRSSTGWSFFGQYVMSSLRFLLPISMFIAVSLLLVSLARPQIVWERRDEQAEGIDIMLAMDVSSSMSETDVAPNRLTAARGVAQRFVKGRKNDRIGLVVFAGEAFSLCPLTTDYTLVQQYLTNLNDQMIRTSGTAIGDALARCINRMRDRPTTDSTHTVAAESDNQRSKVVILLSDGDNTAGNLDPVMAARLARAFKIRLYTIAVGRPERSRDQTVSVDEGILKTIATIGQGNFFRATDAGRLEAVFAQINQLEKAPVRILVHEDIQDFYRVYLYWGVVFLLVSLFLKVTIVGNILED
ncbi:VWA domain-containing protein [Spirosoma sp. KUDC1026]|uniref:VWA domain-containing protein n=1 Tax=Spirosoma sp. KUDC1026 TaxID=2745947 RepID=UPI00159B873A|nr:VWA domain-containing protein [Spirosoma sp. KUDC1026]QKZ15534.1 VWA domain-containing protein [Spirosoma sp. KUDC1026]